MTSTPKEPTWEEDTYPESKKFWDGIVNELDKLKAQSASELRVILIPIRALAIGAREYLGYFETTRRRLKELDERVHELEARLRSLETE